MNSTSEYVAVLQRYKQEHAKQYGIERIGIFGSVALGTHRADSDVDICVEIRKPDIFFLIGIRDDLQEIFHRKVDIVRLREKMNPVLRENINNTAIYA
ncbi:MAG: nucleotidyltransferase domain-containing protein [Dysgonamonadaceae bacterium]|jgi:predicted nucleotidyltransferase|nr:nucleotidyltransferase domain-containing protein [Dysgonamonadaceae bacterium]